MGAQLRIAKEGKRNAPGQQGLACATVPPPQVLREGLALCLLYSQISPQSSWPTTPWNALVSQALKQCKAQARKAGPGGSQK